ncbi:MAG: hypothetical protein AAGE94_18540, partial [Acidobacteriota bacterium]
LQATYASSAGGRTIVARAADLEIHIREPASSAIQDLADIMVHPDMGLFFVLRGGRHLSNAASAWRRVAEKHANEPFTQTAKLVLAQNELSRHSGKAAANRALDLLESANEEHLDVEQLAERAHLINDAARRLGKTKLIDRSIASLDELADRVGPLLAQYRRI